MMRWRDISSFNATVISRQRFRSVMLLLAIGIGVISINLLTGLGEGAKRYVLAEFSILGKQVLIVFPGKNETTGGMPPITGAAPRDMTVQDAEVIARLPAVSGVAPMIVGNVEISHDGLIREAIVLGTSRSFFAIRKLDIGLGRLLPEIPFYQADAVCVLGVELRKQLFGTKPALGQWVRAGDRRFRVIGILQDVGQGLGFDMNEAMLVPVASAQTLFNQESLLRIFVEVRAEPLLSSTKTEIQRLMQQRHDGEEDVTVVAQDAVLSSFENILDTMALAVVGIAAISMLVAGVLIMNIMLITVGQRTQEIGLLKALGASSGTVRQLFLTEAGMMALIGALVGMLVSEALLWGGRVIYPDLSFASPWWAKVAALGLAMLTAMLFAWIPAQKAASMSPVDALLDKREGD